MDVPSTAAGVVKSVAVKKGDRVSKGSVIVQVEARRAGGSRAQPAGLPHPLHRKREAASAADAPQPDRGPSSRSAARGLLLHRDAASEPQHARRPATASVTPALIAIDEAGFARAHASPSVRKFARELGVDLGARQRHRPQGTHHARRREGLGEAGA